MFCSKCGEKLNDDAQFCHACGTKVQTGSQTQTAPSSNKKRNFMIAGSAVAGIVVATLICIAIFSSSNNSRRDYVSDYQPDTDSSQTKTADNDNAYNNEDNLSEKEVFAEASPTPEITSEPTPEPAPVYKTAGDNAVPDFNAYLDNKCEIMSTKVADDHTEIIYMFEPNNKKIVNDFVDLLQKEYNFKLTKNGERIEIYDYYFDYAGPGKGGKFNVSEDEKCSLYVQAYCLVAENIELHIRYADGLEYGDYGDRTSYTVNDISSGSSDSDQSGGSGVYESTREKPVPDCTFCGGSGKCSYCGGDGLISSTTLGSDSRSCMHCPASSGRCSYCNGTGKRY